jgi:site-specific DNA-cytosine methylase
MSVREPIFIEVCAGCGGLSTGFMNAGFKPLLVNELEKNILRNSLHES